MSRVLPTALAVVLIVAAGASATIQQNALDYGNPDGAFDDSATASVTGAGAASVNGPIHLHVWGTGLLGWVDMDLFGNMDVDNHPLNLIPDPVNINANPSGSGAASWDNGYAGNPLGSFKLKELQVDLMGGSPQGFALNRVNTSVTFPVEVLGYGLWDIVVDVYADVSGSINSMSFDLDESSTLGPFVLGTGHGDVGYSVAATGGGSVYGNDFSFGTMFDTSGVEGFGQIPFGGVYSLTEVGSGPEFRPTDLEMGLSYDNPVEFGFEYSSNQQATLPAFLIDDTFAYSLWGQVSYNLDYDVRADLTASDLSYDLKDRIPNSVIHAPEPMSIAVFGLGGTLLVLRHRGRKRTLLRHPIAVTCAVIGGLLGFSGPANAATYDYWFEGAEFESPDWTMVGVAAYGLDGGLTPHQRLRMTPAEVGLNGAAWLNVAQLRPEKDWSASMRGQITWRYGGGADGMALIWQTDGLGANPNYEGSGLSGAFLAITLDSYQNPGEAFSNALEVHSSAGQIGALYLGDALEIGDFFNLSASYDDETNTLSVTFDSDARDPVSGYWNVDLTGLFGAGTLAHVGFAASTGGSSENHDIVQTLITAVPAPPTIAQQPQSLELWPGETAAFAVTATGEGTLTYRWQKDGADLTDGEKISGATTDTLEISNVDAGDADDYRCVVGNEGGDTPSDEATLTVVTLRSLELTETNGSYGDVEIDPEPNDANNIQFPDATEVTLTAVPIEGKAFSRWEVFDANYPDDVNHATIDTNLSTTIVMDTDMHVNAAWKCGSGAGTFLPMMTVLLTFGVLHVTRKQRIQ